MTPAADDDREWRAACAASIAQQAGARIEAYAWATACERHRPFMRGCAWRDNKPCECRNGALREFPA